MPKYLFCGGFNAGTTNTFGGLLEDFCMENNFIISDYALLSQDTFTYISDVHNTTSSIDHFVSSFSEHFILSNISLFLGTTDNQFGFKAGHSTDQCTFLLKQTASYFVTHGSSVHAVFLDASKAFIKYYT